MICLDNKEMGLEIIKRGAGQGTTCQRYRRAIILFFIFLKF